MKRNRQITLMMITVLLSYIIMIAVLLVSMLPGVVTYLKDFFIYITPSTSLVLFFALIVSLTFFVALLSISWLRYKHDSPDTKKYSELSEERSYLEKQLYEINKQLTSDSNRRAEAYHLLINVQDKQTNYTGEVSSDKFLSGFGIDVNEAKICNDLVFVLTPFHKSFDGINQSIKSICTNVKLRAIRGDEEYVPTDLMKHIIKNLVEARIVIAVLDGRNPNVFYELGIAQALSKPTILLASTNEEIPFDLQNQYFILYKDDEQLKEKLTDALLKILTFEK